MKRLKWPGWRPWRRPVWTSTTHKAIRSSRYANRTWRPRPRTVFRRRPEQLVYLHRRRGLRRQALQLGFTPIAPGMWYDPAADCAYVQSSVCFDDVSDYIVRY
ncbi:MAG: hypothetical protein HC914_16225 [Chloroflexaceae bacterium]|nr:hypothetical protein [Chloroflexaceae bacterium]